MKLIENISDLKKILQKKKINCSPINISDLLMDSLAYDNEMTKEQIRSLTARKIYIHEHYISQDLNMLQLQLEDIFQHITSKYKDVKKEPLIWYLLIEEVLANWNNIFWIWSKKIDIKINVDLKTTEGILEIISKILFMTLNEQPLLRYNFTKGLIFVNFLLKTNGLPGIILSYKDRKRILRNLDHYIDFRKEFLLTLQWEIYKNIYSSLYPEQIVDFNTLRGIKQVKNPYVKPWTWWYGEDRKKYTFIKK